MPLSTVYLDHCATSPLSAGVQEKMVRVWNQIIGNPASSHGPGREARRLLEKAREKILLLLDARTTGMTADRLILTSGGTEANHLALLGLAGEEKGKVVISAIEHPSVVGASEELARRGFEIIHWPVNSAGVIDLSQAENLLKGDIRLISVMLANNETGVVQPIAELARICRTLAPRAILHCDAVQAVGKMPVSFRQLNIDALTLTPHKFHGPIGIGGLIIRHGQSLQPLLFGGFQQEGLRPGTESVALAVGFQVALEEAQNELPQRQARLRSLGTQLESAILSGFPSAVIHGIAAPRLPNCANIAFPGINRQAFLMALDQAGIACSTGSACASGSSEPSPVLLAMGLAEELVASSLRFSWGAFTTGAEIATATERILREANRLRPGN